jgi:hypothetical protein
LAISNAQTILMFLEGKGGCCDDCIAREADVKPRQQVSHIREPNLPGRIWVRGPLESLDRGNVEKLLGLFRHAVVSGA